MIGIVCTAVKTFYRQDQTWFTVAIDVVLKHLIQHIQPIQLLSNNIGDIVVNRNVQKEKINQGSSLAHPGEYKEWRALEGLEVQPPYHEGKLGMAPHTGTYG
jgi:hypothetical protein